MAGNRSVRAQGVDHSTIAPCWKSVDWWFEPWSDLEPWSDSNKISGIPYSISFLVRGNHISGSYSIYNWEGPESSTTYFGRIDGAIKDDSISFLLYDLPKEYLKLDYEVPEHSIYWGRFSGKFEYGRTSARGGKPSVFPHIFGKITTTYPGSGGDPVYWEVDTQTKFVTRPITQAVGPSVFGGGLWCGQVMDNLQQLHVGYFRVSTVVVNGAISGSYTLSYEGVYADTDSGVVDGNAVGDSVNLQMHSKSGSTITVSGKCVDFQESRLVSAKGRLDSLHIHRHSLIGTYRASGSALSQGTLLLSMDISPMKK